LHPFSVPSYYDLWGSNFNSIFFYYYPALLRLLAGESEMGMHAGYIVFYIGAGILFYLLCRTMKTESIVPALFLLFSPLSLLTATSIMGDFPFLFFLLAAVYCFVKGLERNDDPLLTAAAMAAAGCAILTKYYGVLILLPLAYLAAARGKYRHLLYFAVLLTGVFAVDLLFSRGREVHCLHVFRLLGWVHSPLRKETLSFLTTLGGVAIFPLSWPALLGKRAKWWGAYIGAFLLVEAVLFLIGWKAPVVICASMYLLNSCILFTLAAVRTLEALRGKNHLLAAMGLWFFSYALFLMLIPNIMAARYVLPLLPPLLVFYCNEADARCASAAKTWYVQGTLLLTLLLGVVLNAADYRLAGIYRAFAAEAKARVPVEGPGSSAITLSPIISNDTVSKNTIRRGTISCSWRNTRRRMKCTAAMRI
jgi:4-amino-4-deoxy-L-arabinose transferase-like glycosyltransferase